MIRIQNTSEGISLKAVLCRFSQKLLRLQAPASEAGAPTISGFEQRNTSGVPSSSASALAIPSGGGPPSRKTKFRTNMKNTIVIKVMRARAQWIESPEPSKSEEDVPAPSSGRNRQEDTGPSFDLNWDIFWGELNTFLPDNGFNHKQLREGQRINHFPRSFELCKKDHMAKNLKRAKRAQEKAGQAGIYDFFPATYTLPSEWGLFVEEYKTRPGLWIAKPAGRAQGKGIFLVERLSQLSMYKKPPPSFNDRLPTLPPVRRRGGARDDSSDSEDEPEIYVVQRYVDRPLLVAGRKFDCRIYVLVLSFSPLHVYLHRGGFCRFTGERFDMASGNLTAHLTNNAVQKKLETFDRTTANKWAIRSLRLYLNSKYGRERSDKCFEGVQEVILRSLEAVQNVVVQDNHSFELYGYDIMLDQDLKPILIEVNAQPSLSYDTKADRNLKFEVVNDALTLVDLEGRWGKEGAEPGMGRPVSYGGYDLICFKNRRVRPHTSIASFLGMEWSCGQGSEPKAAANASGRDRE